VNQGENSVVNLLNKISSYMNYMVQATYRREQRETELFALQKAKLEKELQLLDQQLGVRRDPMMGQAFDPFK